MKRKTWFRLCALLLAGLTAFSLTGCGGKEEPANVSAAEWENVDASSDQAAAVLENPLDPEEMFTERDLEGEYDASSAVLVTLEGSTASGSDPSVIVSDGVVTITAAGVYILSGNLEGMVAVEAADTDKVCLVLDGAEISNKTGAAIYAKEADKLFVTLAEGSQNSLSGTSDTTADGSNIDGVIFSRCDLTVNGTGNLQIEAAEGHGIAAKDDLVIAGGTLTVNAAGHGLEGKDSVRIADGQLDITSGKDGIHSENSDETGKGFVYVRGGLLSLVCGGDGISAGDCLQIDGGDFSILAGGGNGGNAATDDDGSIVSAKGLKAGEGMRINGGSILVDALDDALHGGGDLAVTGGALELVSGDDGIHSDKTVTMAGGSVAVTDSYEGIEGNDVVISGGEIRITASDDGLNAAGGNDGSGLQGPGGMDRREAFGAEDCSITISGGVLVVNAAGDGIDSNGDLTVTGGETYVSGPENGANGAIDYNGQGRITGGVLVAVGSAQMAMNFGDGSTQGSILTNVSECRAQDTVQLLDAEGNVLADFTPERSFSSVLVSCPGLVQGQTYTLSAGGQELQIVLEELIYGNGMGGMNGGMRGRFRDPQAGENGMDGEMPGGFGGPGGRERPSGGQDRGPRGEIQGEERGEVPGSVPPGDV